MSTVIAAELVSADEGRIALEQVDIASVLKGLWSETEMTQRYRNLEERNIEAVYTFPLPLDAVLLELTMELNGKTLRGQVFAKQKAEAKYEKAIDKGDSAVLLSEIEPGLFTVNVGNILPGEKVLIRYRYAQLHHWQGRSLRFQMPTTISPRYGDPEAAGMSPHEVPEHSFTAENRFSLELRVEGGLSAASFECPSHPIGVSDAEGVRVFRLAGGMGLMNRDFVLVFHEPEICRLQGYWSRDDDSFVALASFHPTYPGELQQRPRIIKLVIDCSGSMAGDSMSQAKVAIHEILQSLNSNDRFNITAFGSHHRSLFSHPKLTNRRNLQVAQQFITHLDADMGGTEIGAALEACYQLNAEPGEGADVLLITDGEVWEQKAIINNAMASGHRIFSVGVGSAVSEGFVREIAERTGGACELVSPRENMAEHIVRHFGRIHQPRAVRVELEWPGHLVAQYPGEIETLFSGDTLHLFAKMSQTPEEEARLHVTYEDGSVSTQAVELLRLAPETSFGVSLPRLTANQQLQELAPEEAEPLAVKYQLVTQLTSCVLVYQRKPGEQATDLPELRTVPQMLSAGWGGTGSVDGQFAGMAMIQSKMNCIQSDAAEPYELQEDLEIEMDYMNMPAFLRRSVPDDRGIDTSISLPELSIADIEDLPYSIIECLMANGIETLSQLKAMSREELLKLEGIDEKDVELILEYLGKRTRH